MDFYERITSSHPTVLIDFWDIDCPKGWEGIVEDLVNQLEQHAKTTNNGLRVEQIKSKYGGLRCYVNNDDEYISQLISEAERRSMVTCEVCGELGVRRGRAWISTLCNEHAKS